MQALLTIWVDEGNDVDFAFSSLDHNIPESEEFQELARGTADGTELMKRIRQIRGVKPLKPVK